MTHLVRSKAQRAPRNFFPIRASAFPGDLPSLAAASLLKMRAHGGPSGSVMNSDGDRSFHAFSWPAKGEGLANTSPSSALNSITSVDKDPPVLMSMVVKSSKLVMKFDEILNSTLPALGRFRVLVDGSVVPLASRSVKPANKAVVLRLTSPVTAGQVVRLRYRDKTTANDVSGVIEDAAGNDLKTFATRSVENRTPTSDRTPPELLSMAIDGDTLTMQFNEVLKSTLPDIARFRVLVDGSVQSIASRWVDASNKAVVLRLASPVTADQVVRLRYRDKTTANDVSGVIEDAAGNDLKTFATRSVENRTPSSDSIPPSVVSMTVNGSNLRMVFDETLGDTLPDVARFRVLVDGAERSIASRSVDAMDRVVTIGLASAVSAGQVVRLAYTDKSPQNDDSGVIEDPAGNDLLTFSSQLVTNITPSLGPWWDGGRFSELWGFSQASDKDIDAPEVFSTWSGPADGISNLNMGQNTVAVLDTGIRRTHQDLSANYVGGYDFYYNDGDPSDIDGHGTHVAGTIGAAANQYGVVGSNPAAKLLAVKVLGDSGIGYTSDIIEGVNYAVQSGAKILNLSLGGGGYSQAFLDALDAAGKAGCLSIIAAGNDGTDNDAIPHYPASYNLPSIISVASSSASDWYSSFSNYGLTSVDLYAPGEQILSTTNSSDSSYGYKSGTSMATPLVAGVVSAYWARNPSMTAAQVKARLLATVDPLSFTQDTVTGGRMNMAKMFGVAQGSAFASSLTDDPITRVLPVDSVEAQRPKAAQDGRSSRDHSLYYTRQDINELRAGDFNATENIILTFAGGKDQRLKSVATIGRRLAKKTGGLNAFDGLDSMEALGSRIGLIAVDRKASHDQVLSGLDRLLGQGLISSFELDSTWTTM